MDLGLPVAALAEMVRNRKISALELTRAFIARIEKVDPTLNAVVVFEPERALREAEERDRALAAGEEPGPLHGIPFTLKDVYDTAGDRVTAGCLGLQDNVARADSTIARRLRAAGGILLGKTNTPELECGADTDNLVYGRTVNPYDPGRSAGGSSGGSAAIVAACGSAFDVGCDQGGSLRLPAHYCGVATLRTTPRLVPSTGVYSGLRQGPGGRVSVEGPMCRRVEDLRLILRVIAGPDGIDPMVIPNSALAPEPEDLGKLRIAHFSDNGLASPSPETARAVSRAADALAAHGVEVVEDSPAVLPEGFRIFAEIIGANAVAEVEAALDSMKVTRRSPLLNKILDYMRPFACDLGAYMARWQEWDRFRSEVLRFFERYDALICPVAPREAIPTDITLWDPGMVAHASYCWSVSMAMLPVATVRAGTSTSGLPIGVQIVTGPFQERTALAIAGRIEQALGGWREPLLE